MRHENTTLRVRKIVKIVKSSRILTCYTSKEAESEGAHACENLMTFSVVATKKKKSAKKWFLWNLENKKLSISRFSATTHIFWIVERRASWCSTILPTFRFLLCRITERQPEKQKPRGNVVIDSVPPDHFSERGFGDTKESSWEAPSDWKSDKCWRR